MNGVRNLSKLLQEMNPEQVEGKYVFCTVSDETISSWDQRPMMTFVEKEGLPYMDAAKRNFVFSSAELRDWWGARAQAGRLPPRGFPKSGTFGDRF